MTLTLTPVFPTHVGVKGIGTGESGAGTGIPYACGGKRLTESKKRRTSAVFPTHVGVKGGRRGCQERRGRIPYACGGKRVSRVDTVAWSRYSLRMWG